MSEYSNEAYKIYNALFKRDIPDALKKRYEKAQSLLSLSYSEEEINKCNSIIDRANDLEAVEYAARITSKFKLLSKKFELMIWLSNSDHELYKRYINETDRPVYGKIILLYFSFHSIYKFLKGLLFLLRGK